MKSPQVLAAKLAQQWHSADWRERQLLGGGTAVAAPISQPDTAVLNDAAALRSHLQQWRAVEDFGPGQRAMQERRYRGSSDAIAVPPLATGQTLAVHRRHPPLQVLGHAQVHSDYARLQHPHRRGGRPGFQRLLVRRLVQWRDTPSMLSSRRAHGVATGARLRPRQTALRALAVQATTPSSLNATPACSPLCWTNALTAKPAARGWWDFWAHCPKTTTGCSSPRWPRPAALCADARAPASCSPPLPARRILLVEKRTLPAPTAPAPWHQHHRRAGRGPEPGLARRTVVCKSAAWLTGATWTPGVCMLAIARGHVPHLQALLMDAATFSAHHPLAVAETGARP